MNYENFGSYRQENFILTQVLSHFLVFVVVSTVLFLVWEYVAALVWEPMVGIVFFSGLFLFSTHNFSVSLAFSLLLIFYSLAEGSL